MEEEPLYKLKKSGQSGQRFSYPLLGLIVLILLLIGGSLFLLPKILTKPKPIEVASKAIPTPTVVEKIATVWGTITKVTEAKNQALQSSSGASLLGDNATLTIRADNGKDFQVSVTKNTSISKNQVVGPEGSVKELAATVSYKEIKNGDRVYLTSLLDLGREVVVPADKVVSIKWFETVVPK